MSDKVSIRVDEYTADNIEKIRRHLAREGLSTITKSAVVCASINKYAESLDDTTEITDDADCRAYVVKRDDTGTVIVGTILRGDGSSEALQTAFPDRTLIKTSIAEADVVIKSMYRASSSEYARSIGYRIE